MKKLALIATVLSLSLPLQAADGAAVHAYAAIDAFAPGNDSHIAHKAADGLCNIVRPQGIGCDSATHSYGAYGGRLGALYDLSGIQVGGSVGYLYGGPADARINLRTNPGGTLGLKELDRTYRFLAEGKKIAGLNGPWSAAIGIGAGLAVDHQSISCTESGILVGTCAGLAKKSTTGWFTWELTPSVLYKAFEFGVRLAGFTRGGYTPWNTYGATIAYHL